MSQRIRRRREALGLSQRDVAGAAGLSRQLVGTVERGRHLPSVNAALALARALDARVLTTDRGLAAAARSDRRLVEL